MFSFVGVLVIFESLTSMRVKTFNLLYVMLQFLTTFLTTICLVLFGHQSQLYSHLTISFCQRVSNHNSSINQKFRSFSTIKLWGIYRESCSYVVVALLLEVLLSPPGLEAAPLEFCKERMLHRALKVCSEGPP